MLVSTLFTLTYACSRIIGLTTNLQANKRDDDRGIGCVRVDAATPVAMQVGHICQDRTDGCHAECIHELVISMHRRMDVVILEWIATSQHQRTAGQGAGPPAGGHLAP